MTRPADRTSRVATVLAVTTAFRWGRTRTAVPRRIVVVQAAAKLKTVSGSRIGACGSSGKAPLAVYGYFEPISSGVTI
jgi:hypothetical protein